MLMKLVETVLLVAGAVFVSIMWEARLEAPIALLVAIAIWVNAFFLLLRGLIDYLLELGHVTVPLQFPVVAGGEWKTAIRLSTLGRRREIKKCKAIVERLAHLSGWIERDVILHIGVTRSLVSTLSGWTVNEVECMTDLDFRRAWEAIIPADRVRA